MKITRTLLFLACLSLAACTPAEETDATPEAEEPMEEMAVPTAMAQIQPLQDSGVSGTVVFTEVDGGVQLTGNLNGLQPGAHGFHIHAGTTCADYGGHYNPTDTPHGAPDDEERHTGDLGNLEAGADGTATVDRLDPMLAFEGETAIIGHALIVHQGPDDYSTQPSGNSGPVVGCGVIQLAE